MCTATWLIEKDGYRLFFNRDELRRRLPALPPSVQKRGGVRWIAPTDGESGGSWIAANEFGVTLFLLNGYAPGDRSPPAVGWTSRGALVDELADARSVEDVHVRLEKRDLTGFRSFSLAALDGNANGGIGKWIDGELSLAALPPPAMPLVSSSFDTATVVRTRANRFREGMPQTPTADDHLAYHASHDPQAGPYSVCMHRHDARTVSFSCVTVEAGRVRFQYVPHSPHEGLTGSTATLALRGQPESRSPD